MSKDLDAVFSPETMMDPRALGSLQPTRLSASRSLIGKMIREGWTIQREMLELDAQGNGRARYSITTPQGPLTFLAYLREPAGGNRTSRIIGTSWDMVGSLIDGHATENQVRSTEEEIHKLYEGRAPRGTLLWFRSNQSLRVFRHVRDALGKGLQPNAIEIKKVGYLMRNTGLDGNGTFGTTSFPAIPGSHPLKTSYHAQMLAAYLMRELSVDLVEELARIDSPAKAVRLDPSIKQFIGVGNGSALGLAMLVYNRPVMMNAYISAYVDAVKHVLSDASLGTTADFVTLEALLNRTIRYRALDDTAYRVFAGSKEIASDLRRVRAVVQAARRGDLRQRQGETILAAVHRHVRSMVTREATHSLNTLLLELTPDYCDQLVEERLVFDEHLDLNPQTEVRVVRQIIVSCYAWALDLPLANEEHRDRVWYQSRAAEEPRSGPFEEVPGAHEVIPNYATGVRKLLALIDAYDDDATIGRVVADRPEMEYIARLVVALADKPYAVPHADPHDTDFVPVWLIRLMNSFIHGLDRTEDYLGRTIRGLIFEGAPFREELSEADPSSWWWSYRPTAPSPSEAGSPSCSNPKLAGVDAGPPIGASLRPKESSITAHRKAEEGSVTITYREARLMAGRAYQSLNVPEGSWHGAREFYITALIGSARVPEAFATLLSSAIDGSTGEGSEWKQPSYTCEDHFTNIDNHGQSLLSTGHVLVNLLASRATQQSTRFVIQNVRPDEALEGMKLGLARYRIELAVEHRNGEVTGTLHRDITSGSLEQRYWDALKRFVYHGAVIPSQTFWTIYYRGNAGLFPDTPLSRQHTGATIKDVLKPGQKLTKQFSEEDLAVLMDPDDIDNKNLQTSIM